jgi:hypothetical protein
MNLEITGYMHPHLQDTFRNYIHLLMNIMHNNDEIFARLLAVPSAANLEPDDYRKILDQVLN